MSQRLASDMRTLQVLLVEDSALIQKTLIDAMEEMAPVKVVETVADESEAVTWLRGHPVDLVVIDIFLKTGSGLGVLRAAARLPTPADLIVLSNYATPAMRSCCLALGASRVFDKSTELDDLIAYCNELGESGLPH